MLQALQTPLKIQVGQQDPQNCVTVFYETVPFVREMEGDETLYLKWNQFDENLKQSFREFNTKGHFFDVTLACEEKEFKVHKLILSASSPFFRRLLLKRSHQQANVHPLIFLKGVKAEQLEAVVEFIYHGEVNVLEEQLDSFMLVAKDLQLKGLTALYDKEPNLFQQSLTNTLETKETDQDKYEREESPNKNDIIINKETNSKVVEEGRCESKIDLVNIETDLVNEGTEELLGEENAKILKELSDEGVGPQADEGVGLQADEGVGLKDEEAVPSNALNPKKVIGGEFALRVESIKEILDAGCFKAEEQKANLIDSQIDLQMGEQTWKRETDLLVNKEYGGSKKQDLGQKEYDAVVEKMCKEMEGGNVRPGTKRRKSSRPKDLEHQIVVDKQNDSDLVKSETKQMSTFSVSEEALKETMLKTCSKKGGETESPSEKETTGVEFREPSNFQNLIHKDLIQRTLYKDKREALMERQDRTKTSGSKRHWACKVCFLF